MNLPMKHKQNKGHRKQTGGCQGGGRWERDGLGVWYQQMQTGIYRTDKQQGLTVQHRKMYAMTVMNHNGKNKKKNMYICVAESLCCAAAMNTTV